MPQHRISWSDVDGQTRSVHSVGLGSGAYRPGVGNGVVPPSAFLSFFAERFSFSDLPTFLVADFRGDLSDTTTPHWRGRATPDGGGPPPGRSDASLLRFVHRETLV